MGVKNNKDIAIIGMSGRFPKSNNINEFWEHLINGDELSKFYSDKELIEKGVSQNEIENLNYIKVDSRIDNSNTFDFSFFGYTPDEAAAMDPQIRLFHEHAWLALENAGYNPLSYKGKIGLYASASDNLNWRINNLLLKNENISPFFLNQISNKNFLTTLISYKLNLRGPSYFIDTACSSSLTAVHVACRNLLLRECSMAIVGGVSVDSSTTIGYHYKKGGINSKDGHCRAFDHKSSGVISGEGIGLVVLKRLSDAIDSNDNIYAVIKSSSVNNDGKAKIGYTAPSIEGQFDCIKAAYGAAKISPDSISYIETHGTGTRLGDPIEIEALNKVFENYKNHTCAIGSVKNNLGHLDVAAGITGLIKTVLALKNKQIPPTINYEKPNHRINFNDGPFYVNTKLTKWVANDTPLRAGVSSFGIGGTNAHILLEENMDERKQEDSYNYKLLRFSARTEGSLERYTEKFLKYLKSDYSHNIADISYTLQKGRHDFMHRKFLVCDSKADAIMQIEQGKLLSSNLRDSTLKSNIVFMFPGQGSQYIDMCLDLYKNDNVFRSIMNDGFKLLENLSGENYEDIIYKSQINKDSEEKINKTIYAQPLLFLIEYALAKLLMAWGINPDFMIGHSLGEYSAACISNVFSFEEGLTLVYKRAALINSVDKGEMLAVSVSEAQILPFLNDDVSIAAINSPELLVISGTIQAMKEITKRLKNRDIAYMNLKASHAFHSKMMEPIKDKFKSCFENVLCSDMQIPIVSNLSGKPILSEEASSSNYWTKHLLETVNFSKGIEFLLKANDTVFIEIGPGNALTNLVKRNNRRLNLKNTSISVVRSAKKSVDDNKELLLALGTLWSKGIDVNWDKYYYGKTRYKVPIPTYSFDTPVFQSKVNPMNLLKHNNFIETKTNRRNVLDWFYLIEWKKSFISETSNIKILSNCFLIFLDNDEFSKALTDKLKIDGNDVIIVKKGSSYSKTENFEYEINPLRENDYELLFQDISINNKVFDQIIYCWGIGNSKINFESNDFKPRFQQANDVLLSLLKIYNNFRLEDYEKNIKLTVFSNLNHEILHGDSLNYNTASTSSMLRILSQENNKIKAFQIDVNVNETNTDLILNELKYNFSDLVIGYRGKQRWTQRYENIKLGTLKNETKVIKYGLYVITGGLGKIGYAFAKYLIETYEAKVILLGRSILPPSNEWDNILICEDYDLNIIEKIEKLKSLKDNVDYYQCDVSNFKSFSSVIENIEEKYNQINGVIHAAGVTNHNTFRFIKDVTNSVMEEHFKPKLNGLINLYKILYTKKVDFVWITSSLSTVLGGVTYMPYAAANGFMNSFVNANKNEISNWYCVNLDAISENNNKAINFKELMVVFERSFSFENNTEIIISVDSLGEKLEKDNTLLLKNVEPTGMITERPSMVVAYKDATSPTEKQLQIIWVDFFKLERIGIQDDFFDLGGDSLKAITIMKRISNVFGIEISIHSFYDKLSIEKIALEIDIMLNIISMEEKKNSSSDLNELKV
ncbi:type I polyketide synthase [Gillisia sp. Hel_I_29]|uniref:type I polyketide synthase n=1 Tax=Gillisia sp. Hel_I_29 TaxID=1249975 RepID=UPI000B29A353|nr:type I polyketide synthase [Gillisia sp. Hel_I_29]